MNTKAPHRLGRYQLLERIAVGGMAEVYKACAQGISGFEKTVVVKRLLPQHQRDQELLTMFVDEARLLGRMRHENIAEVYDIDHDGGEYFFALEYVEGADVRALLDARPGQPLPLAESLWIARELARALAYAHTLADDKGNALHIIHRDVSPSNVIVDRKGAVKLVDFGVAKWLAQRSETRHGVLKGKVNYMSPEQCRGEPLDQRSDIFALGVLLYEMTVGKKPFSAASDFETLKAIAEGHYVLPSLRLADYPRGLEAIVAKALELRREDRFPTTSALVEHIAAFAASAGIAMSPHSLAARVQEVCAARGPGVPLPAAAYADTVAKAPIERTATAAAFAGASPQASPLRRHRRVWPLVVAAVFVLASGLWLFEAKENQAPNSETKRRQPSADPAPIVSLPAAAPSPHVDDDVAVAPAAAVTVSEKPPKPKAMSARPVAPKPTSDDTPPMISQPRAENPSTDSVWDPDSPVPP